MSTSRQESLPNELMTIQEAGEFLHVAPATLRRWEADGKVRSYKTSGGHRRFAKEDLIEAVGAAGHRPPKKLTVGYCRVSSSGQKDDLERQKKVVANYCEVNGYRFKIISDIGSGLNYSKKGLQDLIRLICSNDIERVVINTKDRLVRFGFEMLESVCEMHGVTIEVINSTEEMSDEEEMVQDVLSIITVFSSRLYGKRSHKSKKIIEENRRMFNEKTKTGSSEDTKEHKPEEDKETKEAADCSIEAHIKNGPASD